MAGVLYMRELSFKDAMAVAWLGRKLYPKGFREGYRSIRTDLKKAETERCNLSIGLFRGRRLVGCILAYQLDTANLKGLPEVEKITDDKVIYVNDLVMDPGHARHIREMIERFFRLCRVRFPHLSLAAHGLQIRMHHWIKSHATTFEKMGYQLTSIQEVPENGPEPDLYLAQLEPIFRKKQHLLLDSGRNSARTKQQSYKIGGRTYSVELVRDETGWLALKSDWDSLLTRTPGCTVFQTLDYLQIWWLHFGLSRKLYILIIRRSGNIIGIAPLQVTPLKVLGHYYRMLEFIGSRWEVERATFLLPFDSQECFQAIQQFLFDNKNDWDLCHFREQPPGSAIMEKLQAGLKDLGYPLGIAEDSICPYLQLHGTWQEFLATRSQKFRKNLKSARKKLSEFGKIEYVTHKGENLAAHFESYKELEEKSWKATQKVGCNRSVQHYGFYRDLAAIFGQKKSFIIRFHSCPK